MWQVWAEASSRRWRPRHSWPFLCLFPPLQWSAGSEWGRGKRPESWTLLPGVRLPNTGRVCRTTAAQPSRAKTEEFPADAPESGGLPGWARRGGVAPGRLYKPGPSRRPEIVLWRFRIKRGLLSDCVSGFWLLPDWLWSCKQTWGEESQWKEASEAPAQTLQAEISVRR